MRIHKLSVDRGTRKRRAAGAALHTTHVLLHPDLEKIIWTKTRQTAKTSLFFFVHQIDLSARSPLVSARWLCSPRPFSHGKIVFDNTIEQCFLRAAKQLVRAPDHKNFSGHIRRPPFSPAARVSLAINTQKVLSIPIIQNFKSILSVICLTIHRQSETSRKMYWCDAA